jgi:YHS domain-containing protein
MIRTAWDPVCEMEIRTGDAVEKAIFEGHRVYFCSENCYAEFLDTPHRYVGWVDDRGTQAAERGRRFGDPTGAGPVEAGAGSAAWGSAVSVTRVA